jgi:hypothetical protein
MQPEASETITLLYIGKAHILRDGPSYSNIAYTYLNTDACMVSFEYQYYLCMNSSTYRA